MDLERCLGFLSLLAEHLTESTHVVFGAYKACELLLKKSDRFHLGAP